MYEPESVWAFEMADHVRFGPHAVTELDGLVADFNADSVLVITDEGVQAAGLIEQVRDTLEPEIAVDVYASVRPDPSEDVFADATAYARDTDPDALIAVGGGSSIDVAKTTSILVEHGGDLMEYVAPPTGNGEPVPGPGVPTVAVPTTSGTGSETSPVSVISLPDQEMKVGISSRHQRPDAAVLDPLLTVSLPPEPTATSGIDALTHAIEAYTTRQFDSKERAASSEERPDYGGRTELTDLFARRAIELIGDNLPRAVNRGHDVEARKNMALASFMAGVSFTNAGLGVVHAMAMTVGAEFKTPHGATIAAVLPEAIRYNIPANPGRYATIAELLGEDVDNLSSVEAGRQGARAVERLVSNLDLPEGLGDLGVREADVPLLVEKTLQLERLLVGNPRRIDEEKLETLYRESL